MKILKTADRHVFTAEGETVIHGKPILYRVISEETFLEVEDGKPAASMFSYTYLRTNTDPDETAGMKQGGSAGRKQNEPAGEKSCTDRPVLFIFNGGPGS